MDSNGQMTMVLPDVARMETSEDGYLFVNLFGEEKFVRGRLMRIDFVDDNAIVLKDH
jgi:predicted RNA-binding protein